MKTLLTILFSWISLIAYSQNNNVIIKNEAFNFKALFNTSMQPGVSCYRIPAIITAPNGDLIAAIDERVKN